MENPPSPGRAGFRPSRFRSTIHSGVAPHVGLPIPGTGLVQEWRRRPTTALSGSDLPLLARAEQPLGPWTDHQLAHEYGNHAAQATLPKRESTESSAVSPEENYRWGFPALEQGQVQEWRRRPTTALSGSDLPLLGRAETSAQGSPAGVMRLTFVLFVIFVVRCRGFGLVGDGKAFSVSSVSPSENKPLTWDRPLPSSPSTGESRPCFSVTLRGEVVDVQSPNSSIPQSPQ